VIRDRHDGYISCDRRMLRIAPKGTLLMRSGNGPVGCGNRTFIRAALRLADGPQNRRSATTETPGRV
jgi:hypothetical protein